VAGREIAGLGKQALLFANKKAPKNFDFFWVLRRRRLNGAAVLVDEILDVLRQKT